MHIGLFDSGVGGLTVLKEIRNQIPDAKYSYLGDTARLPYGNKAPETLEQYSQENMEKLDRLGVDAVVVACHSASSVLLNEDHTPNGAPLINVIAPSCEQAVIRSHSQKIGVLSTKATARSQVYPNYISTLAPEAQVISQDGPLLVPLVEEGLIEDEITEIALKRYLNPMLKQGVDVIILGCTHYPILKSEMAKISGPDVHLLDPAVAVAEKLKLGLGASTSAYSMDVYLTDHSPHFVKHAQKILGETEMKIHYPN